MLYRDPLYGIWELPKIIERIAHTREMVRLRNISQSVLPNNLNPYGPIPSRFHHGLGVCYLALIVQNQQKESIKDKWLPVAGLLHDAGNPPFSHLGETFLKEVTGKDGESFFENILDGSEISQILRNNDIPQELILKLITGNLKPFSDVLHGSMDIDNLDNVGRYDYSAGFHGPFFSAPQIASCFCFKENKGWCLRDEGLSFGCFEQAMNWKRARKVVYETVYDPPHIVAASMIYRALEFAFIEGKLNEDFFRLDDYQALEFLKTKGSGPTRELVELASRWEWHVELCDFKLDSMPAHFPQQISYWSSRKLLADTICRQKGLFPQDICVLISRSKEGRRITLPFHASGRSQTDIDEWAPTCRIRVFARHGFEHLKNEVEEIVKDFISN